MLRFLVLHSVPKKMSYFVGLYLGKVGHFFGTPCIEPKFYDISNFKERPTFWSSNYPFGAEAGYDTNVGVVKVPDQPIFGYIWTEGSFKIHAAPPSSRATCTSSGAPGSKLRRGRAGG